MKMFQTRDKMYQFWWKLMSEYCFFFFYTFRINNASQKYLDTAIGYNFKITLHFYSHVIFFYLFQSVHM